MLCPQCGKEISEDANFCSYCGKNLKSQNVNDNSEPILKNRFFISASMLFLLIIIGVYAYLSKVGSTIDLYDSSVPKILPKADDCNSPFVESKVISIFKENDPYFKTISLKSIDEIELQSKELISESENPSKYICSGIIEMTSARKGFKPVEFNENNIFYKIISIEDDYNKIKKFTNYSSPVIYSSQIIDDNNIIEIDEFNLGEFSCKGICDPVYKFEKKVERIKKQETVEEEQQNTEINTDILVNTINTEPSDQKEIKKEKKKKKFRLFRRKNEQE